MIDPELASAEEAINEALSRFALARALGAYSTTDAEEASSIRATVEQLKDNVFPAHEGIDIWVTDLGLDAKLYAEQLDPQSSIWANSLAGSSSYNHNISRISPYRQLFVGKLVEYDEETEKVWVYNSRHDFRVLYGEGIVMKAVVSAENEAI
ncbi:MAG TPA: hypothetical protein VIH90_00650 [Candidatus Saccharimonadales bacterium]